MNSQPIFTADTILHQLQLYLELCMSEKCQWSDKEVVSVVGLPWVEWLTIIIFFIFYFFRVRLLSVLRGYSFLLSPPQQPMTSDFEGFSIPDFIHFIYYPILILEKEPVFPFWMFSAKQGNCWYHFYNVFGMTRSLTGDWTRDLPHSKTAL